MNGSKTIVDLDTINDLSDADFLRQIDALLEANREERMAVRTDRRRDRVINGLVLAAFAVCAAAIVVLAWR